MRKTIESNAWRRAFAIVQPPRHERSVLGWSEPLPTESAKGFEPNLTAEYATDEQVVDRHGILIA
jgi:hypothetical protein